VEEPLFDAQITFRLPKDKKLELIEAAKRRRGKHNWLARDIVLRWLDQDAKRRERNAAKKAK